MEKCIQIFQTFQTKGTQSAFKMSEILLLELRILPNRYKRILTCHLDAVASGVEHSNCLTV